MGEHELQEALRGKSWQAAHRAWQTAETAVAARRADDAARCEALRETLASQLADAVATARREAQAAAAAAVRQQRLAAEHALGERMHAVAVRLLATLGGAKRRELWQELTRELPPADWRRVRVHPDDLDLARQSFPDAAVTSEPGLIGGLLAETADGRVVVDNSLRGRLERGWPTMLAPLLAAVDEEVNRNAAGSSAAG